MKKKSRYQGYQPGTAFTKNKRNYYLAEVLRNRMSRDAGAKVPMTLAIRAALEYALRARGEPFDKE